MVRSSKKSSVSSLSRSPPSNNFDGVNVNPSNECNGLSSEPKDVNLHLFPVDPISSGEGLPYAPENWPSPGDTWSWRVGKRVTGTGHCLDRFLYLPQHLKKSYTVGYFSSKAAVERFIQREFPGSDVNAFFASFCWKIPAKMEPLSELNPSSGCPEFTSPEETKKVENKAVEEVHGKTSRKRKQSAGSLMTTYRRRTRQSFKTIFSSSHCNNGGIIDLCSLNEASISMSTSKDPEDSSCSETDQFSRRGIDDLRTPQNSLVEKTGEDFNDYLNSLDDILGPAHSETQFSSTKENSPAKDEMAESRRKLSSFLIMDFPFLAASENLPHMAALASKIQADPSLSVDEIIKLKLVEEIALIGKAFLETEETMKKSDNFFTNLDENKAKVSDLREQYKELEEKISKLMDEKDSKALVLEGIDNQIAQLQLRREEISSTIEEVKKECDELINSQNTIANTIPALVGEIKEAHSEKAEWEIKKVTSAQRKSEILAKYASLKGYSF